PNIHSQLPNVASAELTTYAASWPTTIIKVFKDTKRPRSAGGTTSAMYIGDTIDTPPTATPRKVRAAPSAKMEPAIAHHKEPIMKIAPPISSVLRLPHASAARPATSAPTAAPTKSIDVTHPSCWAVMEKSGPINNTAPDITPVS